MVDEAAANTALNDAYCQFVAGDGPRRGHTGTTEWYWVASPAIFAEILKMVW
jgi:hypothetical protein